MVVGRLLSQIDVINAHHLAPVHVNDLLIQQIAAQQQKSFGIAEWCPMVNSSPHAHSAAQFVHFLQREKPKFAACFHHERRDPERVLLRSERNLAHPRNHLSSRVEHRRSQELGKRDERHHWEHTQGQRQKASAIEPFRNVLFLN